MEKEMIWLSTSLFCNRDNWHELLADGILPFVENTKLKDVYTIEFNYLSGENIRFSLLTDTENAGVLAGRADQYFKHYFSNKTPALNEIILPVDRVFMAFPVNTIQYGLYPVQKINRSEFKDYLLEITLSQIMLEALKDDIIDDETIITFAFYLQMGLIKTINLLDKEFVTALKNTYNNGAIESEGNQLKFQESKEALVEITYDVMRDNADLPEWFNKWLNTCNVVFVDKDMNAIYRKVVYSLYKHLGINIKMNELLSCFIKNMLLNEEVFTVKTII